MNYGSTVYLKRKVRSPSISVKFSFLKSIKFGIKISYILKVYISQYTLKHKTKYKLIWQQFSAIYQPYSGFLFYDSFNEIEDLNSAVKRCY
jgi:hypothetical protein